MISSVIVPVVATNECLNGKTIGTENLKSALQPTIYPNPVKNILIIESGALKVEVVRIVDLSGKTIYQFNETKNQINVSALLPGFYFVKLETDKGIVTEKFIKG